MRVLLCASAPVQLHPLVSRTRSNFRGCRAAVTSARTGKTDVLLLPAGVEEKSDGRSIRRSLNQTGRYTRQPNNNKESQELMENHGVGYSASGLVAQMREQENTWVQGEVSVHSVRELVACFSAARVICASHFVPNSWIRA